MDHIIIIINIITITALKIKYRLDYYTNIMLHILNNRVQLFIFQ